MYWLRIEQKRLYENTFIKCSSRDLPLSRPALTRRRPHCIQESSFNTWVITILDKSSWESSFTEHTCSSAFHSVLFHVKLTGFFLVRKRYPPCPLFNVEKSNKEKPLKYLIFSNIAPGTGS